MHVRVHLSLSTVPTRSPHHHPRPPAVSLLTTAQHMNIIATSFHFLPLPSASSRFLPPGRTRSSSTMNAHDQESIIAGSSIQGKRKSMGYSESSPLRALKEREKRALEEGLEDAANQVRMAGRADRARASLPGARVTAGAIVDFDAIDSPVRRDSTSSLSDTESSYMNGAGTNAWKYDRKIKMLMLGDVGVGKTALMHRWTE